MKKKVLLLSQVFPPETNAGANRLGSMAEVLSKYYDVRVVALKPSNPSPALYKRLSLEHHDSGFSYEIKRTFAFHPRKGRLLGRALREHVMAFRLAARAVSVSADIVVTSPPSMFLIPVGLMLARVKRAKFVCDVRDIIWNYAEDTAGSSPVMTLAMHVLKTYILSALRRADLVVGVTPGIAELLIEDGLAPEKVATVPNGVSNEMLEAAHTAIEGTRPTRPKVVYAGCIGYNQGVGVLLDAAYTLPEVDFVLAGDGPELPLLKKKARKLGTANVYFRGYLSREDLLSVYAEGDILFAKVRSTPTLDATSVPTKLFEYMATGKPLVYAGRGLAIELLDKIGCAVTVPPEDPEAITAAIQDLLWDADRMRILGSKGRDFVRHNYHRDKLMEGLARQLEERFGE